jgi:hypothetical protein
VAPVSLAGDLVALRNAAQSIENWHTRFLPGSLDASRFFEFAALVGAALTLKAATGQAPLVVTAGSRTFAGSPGTRGKYNHIEVGDYRIDFGVRFRGSSGAMHAPDVVVTSRTAPDNPLIVIECKHYSGSTLPKEIVMAFVGLLTDLHRGAFQDCERVGYGLAAIPKPQDEIFCEMFNGCQSRLVVTLPASQAMIKLGERYQFEIVVKRPWQDDAKAKKRLPQATGPRSSRSL